MFWRHRSKRPIRQNHRKSKIRIISYFYIKRIIIIFLYKIIVGICVLYLILNFRIAANNRMAENGNRSRLAANVTEANGNPSQRTAQYTSESAMALIRSADRFVCFDFDCTLTTSHWFMFFDNYDLWWEEFMIPIYPSSPTENKYKRLKNISASIFGKLKGGTEKGKFNTTTS